MESILNEDLKQRLDLALDTIRPYMNADGGDVRIIDVTAEGVLQIELLGACGTCPMSPMTMKAGVEEAIIGSVKEIKKVEALNMTEEGLIS